VVTVIDDAGQQLLLPGPARRIVALAPHAAELVFGAGAGDRLKGVTAHCDYPPEAARLPRVGDATRLDREALLALRPDLVVAWTSGNRPQDLAWLDAQGIPVYHSQPERLEAIADNLLDIGRLAATETAARNAAAVFLDQLGAIRSRYQDVPPLRVFFQVWHRPLITVGADHLITQALRLCGGQPIFPGLQQAAAPVSEEAVIAADPEAIVAAVSEDGTEDPFARWRRWNGMSATARGRFVRVPADLINRPAARILIGAGNICLGLHR
jgi:iron complex transport system substrate-binding protein